MANKVPTSNTKVTAAALAFALSIAGVGFAAAAGGGGQQRRHPRENIPSVNHSGPIYNPTNRTSNSDLSVLLAHYGIQASVVHTNTDSLIGDLDQGRKVIVGLNDKIIWNKPGDPPSKTTSSLPPASTPGPGWCISTTPDPHAAATSRCLWPTSNRHGVPATTSP